MESFNGNLLFEPWSIRNTSGEPFRVFLPFWRACLSKSVAPPLSEPPGTFSAPGKWPHLLELSDLKLQSNIDWASGLRETWQPGESGAQSQLQYFQKQAIHEYSAGRDLPGVVGTSRLSPHLRFGEISPGQVWHAVVSIPNDQETHGQDMINNAAGRAACQAYLRQICWREFAYQLLHHHPESAEQALRPEFAAFPWKNDPRTLRDWTQGKTGYFFVDAGMRELWHTGWMHNRVRMVVASFLVKHLLIGWQEGAAWFWDTLVDADLANNSIGWQKVAGRGADAAPYFRIFNPVIQGEKFDPTGASVRRWVPELSGLPDEWIHKPWKAPVSTLIRAGVQLGTTYPAPIVDHDQARDRALRALSGIKGK